MKSLEIILKSKRLKSALAYILKNNKSLDLPYHNLQHTLSMLNRLDEYRCFVCISSNYEYELIQIAILFHDFNHSGGKLTDDKNIELALEGLGDFIKKNAESYTMKELYIIKDIIEATQYPYIINKDLTISQKIIRDLDLMVIFDENLLQSNIFGIAKELGVSYKDCIFRYIDFLNTIKFNTDYFKLIYSRKIGEIIKQLQKIETIL